MTTNLKRSKEKPLSKNRTISMADIKRRKKKLEDDLELLEGDFEHRISSAQKKVLGPLKPIDYIKKHPFKAVGTSVVVGIAFGLIGSGKSSNSTGTEGAKHKEKLFELLFNEVKRVAARKAATYISEMIDEKISKK